MRKNVKNIAKCGTLSYVECRNKCEKRNLIPKCEYLKRTKQTTPTEIKEITPINQETNKE